ncbi:AAA family ATPase [Cystobacter fuscus]
MITDVLPLLQRLIGPQPLAPGLFAQEARNRFDVVFPRFVAALVSKEHPLVLFLDELQWADAPSLQLIRALLTEPRLEHLLIVGAYREDEVGSTHPLSRMKEELEQHGTRVTSLTVAPLEPGHVVQLVSDMFHWDAGRAAPLARLLWERSGATPSSSDSCCARSTRMDSSTSARRRPSGPGTWRPSTRKGWPMTSSH